MGENYEGPKQITTAEALTDLNNPEHKTLLECLVYLQWLDQEMAEIQKIPTENVAGREEAEFRLTLQDAELREESGRIHSARVAYEDALYNAQNSKNPTITAMIPEIEKAMNALPDNKGVTRHPDDI